MDSDSDTGQQSENISDDNQLKFVNVLKKYQILLDKSQLPAVKEAKKKACLQMINDLRTQLRMDTDEKKLYKKINNMKTQIKRKTDINETGNKKITLSNWEKAFFDLLKPETNTVFARVPGAVSTGLNPGISDAVAVTFTTMSDLPALGDKRPSIPPPPRSAKKQKTADGVMENAETDETRVLSTSQLQRLVLLEQLKLIRLKQQVNNAQAPRSEYSFHGHDDLD